MLTLGGVVGGIQPCILAGAVIALALQIKDGNTEEIGQSLGLLLGGRLTAGLELFNSGAGQLQFSCQCGAAETALAAQLLNTLCHSDHRIFLLSRWIESE